MNLKAQIEQVSIPTYTRKQESFNVNSHALGVPLTVAIFVFALVLYVTNKISPLYLFGLTIFAISALTVYLISSVYHYLSPDSYAKKMFRVLDHCAIFLLIAGTYTPICLVISTVNWIGLFMVITEWVCAFIGIILNGFFLKKKSVEIISLVLYILMGWLVIYCGGFRFMTQLSFSFVLAGGITYTIGSVLYAIGHKKATCHSIFHVFVLVSTILQTVGIMSLFI